MTTTKQILVVDDEPQVRDLTCRALRRLGVNCKEASDGYEAYAMVKEEKFDGVIADLRMPNRHGFALCNDLLKMKTPPKLMVLTGVRDDRIAFDLMNRGVKRIFHKPVQYDRLAQDVLATIMGRPAEGDTKKTVSEVLKDIEKSLCDTTQIYSDRLKPLFDDVANLSLPPKAARDFVARLAKSEGDLDKIATLDPKAQRHRQQRASCFTVATAVETDANWKPLSEPFKLSVRDISEGGMRLLHTRSINSKYLAMSWYATQLTAEEICMPCRITRCKPYLTFYEIGLQFVMAD